ncbi:hypothetical protein QTP88_016300 [Uroleucon formosanum]
MWNEVKIVHGKPRHSQSQGSIERADRDVQEMLAAWMGDNNSSDWPSALRFIQFKKNRAFHSDDRQENICIVRKNSKKNLEKQGEKMMKLSKE